MIHVSGLKDGNKAVTIEQASNGVNFGRELFAHIRNSEMGGPEKTGMYKREEYAKYVNNMMLKDTTGHSLADLDFRSDGVYAKDGENVLTALGEAFGNSGLSDEAGASFMRTFAAAPEKYRKYGPDGVADMSLSIDFSNGKLVDTATKLGYGDGQRDWLDKLTGLRGNMREMSGYLRESALLQPNRGH
ncbi:MAG: DUF4885 domain-containing protein [Candidatus Accumulibacter sp.]|nr:DUF4885 domain-containing protein [Accumulibacter sp.]